MAFFNKALKRDTPNSLSVRWGEAAVLAEDLWKAVLPTDPTLIDTTLFSLLTQAKNGFLTLDNVVLREGDTFSIKDITSGSLVYYHAETTSEEDLIVVGCQQNSIEPLEIALKILA
jgi:hypothetical protein